MATGQRSEWCMSLANRMAVAFRSIWKRQQLALANLTGNAFLLFVLYATFATHDLTTAQWVQGTLVMIGVSLCWIWLLSATLAAFHADGKDTPFGPTFRRLPRFLPWALALIVLIIWVGWLASAMTVYLWIIGVVGTLVLLPLLSQAAGGGFSRDTAIRVISSEQYWLTATILLVAGVYLPFMLMKWVPVGDDLIIRSMTSGMRFGFCYVLAMLSWLTLAAFIANLGCEMEAGEGQTVAEQSPLAASGGERLHGDAELPLQ